MAALCAEKGCLAFANGKNIITAVEPTNATERSSDEREEVELHHLSINDSPVVCLKFSPSGTLLAGCTDDKVLRIWGAGSGWSLRGDRVLAKRATALAFTSDDEYLLVADKTGDLYQYRVADLSLSGSLLLGHLSMLLDMVLLPSNSHVITCDRDEKIRVSNYPNTYNIETFCLGHTEFVSAVCVYREWPHLLLSGSGDGTLRSWNWREGRLLDTAASKQEGVVMDQGTEAVTGVCCSGGGDDGSLHPLVVVSLERSPHLLIFTLSSDGKLTQHSNATVTLATPPLSMTFDWSDRLWVCHSHQSEPILCYQRQGNMLAKVAGSDSPILDTLNTGDHFRDLSTTASTRDWDSLRKRDFDNLSAYFARKTERIREQEEKKGDIATKTKTTINTAAPSSMFPQGERDNMQCHVAAKSGSNSRSCELEDRDSSKELSSSSECPPPDAKKLRTESES